MGGSKTRCYWNVPADRDPELRGRWFWETGNKDTRSPRGSHVVAGRGSGGGP